ncbi:MAG: F0F1 ATP synthase subunit B [Nitrospirae bacterium]|nr:F0F1 ATP synthase subunit B [Nitrospirota bacterium]
MQNESFKIKNAKRSKYLFFIPLLYILISPAFASTGEGGHNSSWLDLLWRVMNFGILLVLLYILLKKFRLKEVLSRRSEGIAKAMKDAEEAKETARKGLEEIQNRLRQKDKEIETIINTARIDGEKEKVSLTQEGERIGEGIIRQARENIDQEVRKAKDSLRKEVVNLALELAEGNIKKNLKKEDQEKILMEYIKKVSNGSERK